MDRGAALVARAVVLLALVTAAPVAAQERPTDELVDELQDTLEREDELTAELTQTERAIARVQQELAEIQGRLMDARAALNRAEGQLALADEALISAEANRDAAEENLAQAERLLATAEEELAREESSLNDQVAATYKYGAANQGELFLRVVQEAQTPNDLITNVYKLRSVVSYQDGIVRRVSELRAERERLHADAEVTRDLARDRREDAVSTLEVVTRLHAEAKAIADDIAIDEAKQRVILQRFEADAAAQEQLLQQVEARRQELEAELAADRARRIALGEVCPVVGAVVGRDFINDWGFPRSGGRTHKGTDVFAGRGTPVVSMFAGTVKDINAVERGLGGITVSVWTGPGEYWYHAHLDRVAPGLSVGDAVAANELLGTVGNTGNARTTPPHLHIGHYVNGTANNPYPSLELVCR